MGLVTGLLLSPVRLLAWTAEQILEIAEDELHDEASIRAALVRLNEEYDEGRIDDEEFALAEDALMERLDAARTRSRGAS